MMTACSREPKKGILLLGSQKEVVDVLRCKDLCANSGSTPKKGRQSLCKKKSASPQLTHLQ